MQHLRIRPVPTASPDHRRNASEGSEEQEKRKHRQAVRFEPRIRQLLPFVLSTSYLDMCLCVLSDDLEQDIPWVQQALRVILENKRPMKIKHARAKSMTIVKLLSDHRVGQFKNR